MSDEHDADISKMLMQPIRRHPDTHQNAGKWRFRSAARLSTAAGGLHCILKRPKAAHKRSSPMLATVCFSEHATTAQ